MTCLDIYHGALALTGNRPASAEADYSGRAAEIIPMVIMSLLPLDRMIKRNAGNPSAACPELPLSLEEEWPLEKEFFACAAYYLASELLIHDDPEQSNLLYVRAEAMRRIISDTIPYTLEKIR